MKTYYDYLEKSGIKIRLRAILLERGVVAALVGGSLQHIGAVALAIPRPSLDNPNKVSSSVSTLSVISHKDDLLAREYALKMSSELNTEISFTCGIHIDNPSLDQLNLIMSISDQLVNSCIQKIKEDSKLLRSQWNTDEQVKAVDSDGKFLKGISRKIAHDGDGILHEAFEILLVDNNDLILCRRSEHKKLWHGYLSGTCAGHPFVQETNEAGALRRLKEETGVKTTLNHIGNFIYKESFEDNHSENEYCYVYVGKYTNKIDIDSNEISEIKHMSVQDIDLALESNSEQFTPWFLEAYKIYKERLKELA